MQRHRGAEDGLQDERNISNQSASFHYHISTTYVTIKYCLICWFKESAFFAKASALLWCIRWCRTKICKFYEYGVCNLQLNISLGKERWIICIYIYIFIVEYFIIIIIIIISSSSSSSSIAIIIIIVFMVFDAATVPSTSHTVGW